MASFFLRGNVYCKSLEPSFLLPIASFLAEEHSKSQSRMLQFTDSTLADLSLIRSWLLRRIFVVDFDYKRILSLTDF